MLTRRDPVDAAALLKRSVFGVLEPTALGQLQASARVERFNRPTLLNAAGTPVTSLRLVVSGQIAIVARRASGAEVALGDVGVDRWATWLACFAPTPPDHDFWSSASCTCVAFPVATVRAICTENPQIYPLVIAEIGTSMRMLMEWAGQSVLVSPEQRMAKLLCLLARAQSVTGKGGTLRVNQQRLAQLARCSRQSANALLGSLEQKGLIRIAYARFEIDDLPKLAAFAE